jgi:hypothetical protein
MIEYNLKDDHKDIPDMTDPINIQNAKKRTSVELQLDAENGVKKPLGIKIDPATDERLKIARFMSKQHGASFNVSLHLEKHLEVLLEMLEKQLEYKPQDYKLDGKKVVKK